MQIVTSKGAATASTPSGVFVLCPREGRAGDILANRGRRVVMWLPLLTRASVSGP